MVFPPVCDYNMAEEGLETWTREKHLQTFACAPAMECGQRDHTLGTGHQQGVLQPLGLPALPRCDPQHAQKDVMPDSSVSMLEPGLSASSSGSALRTFLYQDGCSAT